MPGVWQMIAQLLREQDLSQVEADRANTFMLKLQVLKIRVLHRLPHH